MEEEAAGKKTLLPRRHHYIPQFYLKFFVHPLPGRRESGVWRFERSVNAPRYLAPSVAAVERHYYSIPTKEGGQNPRVEQLLLAPVDGAGALLLQQVLTEDIVFNRSERHFLSLFLAVMLVRVPARREQTEQMAAEFAKFDMEVLARTPGALESVLLEMEQQAGSGTEVDVERLRRYLLSNPKVKAHPLVSLESIAALPLKLAPYIFAMRWLILKTDGFPFLTSDNPVVYVDPTAPPGASVGLGSPNVEVTFPLSPSKCLLAKHDLRLRKSFEQAGSDEELRRLASTLSMETRYRRATREEVVRLNTRVIEHARQYVFAPTNDAAMARFITRRLGTRRRPQQAFQVLKNLQTGLFVMQHRNPGTMKDE